jgi:hypothetical protein
MSSYTRVTTQSKAKYRVSTHTGLSVEVWSAAEVAALLVRLGVLVELEAEEVVLRGVEDDSERLLDAVKVLDGVVTSELLGDGVVDDGVDDDVGEVGEAEVKGVVDEANDEGCEEDEDLERYSEMSTHANSYNGNIENSRRCQRRRRRR